MKNNVISQKQNMRNLKFREFSVLTVLGAIIIVLSIATPTFSTPLNLINVVRQTVEISIMAIGMTFVIVSAEIDLSVGSIFGATAMLAALLIKTGTEPTLAFFASISMGCGIGLLNGVLSTKARMPAFIVTLGTMQLFRSVAYGISNGQSVSAFPESVLNSWVFKMGSSIGNIPVQVIIMAVMFAVAHIIMSKTKFGFDTYATGGNKRAAQLGGINTDRIKIITFVINGALCAFAGMISISYLKSVPTTAGGGREMDIIAAVILGGTALMGGKGTILGTLIGATIMSVIRNGMVLLAVPAFWQSGFIGVVIILAVLLDTWITRSSKGR
jgi:simple sugar transport system permease protein/ribose transport system permease protein